MIKPSTSNDSKLLRDNPLFIYRRLLQYARQQWLMFALGIFGTICYSLVDSSLVYVVKASLDEGFIAKNAQFIRWLPALLAAVFLIRAISGFTSTYCITWVGRTVVMKLRQQLFSHLLRLPARYFDQTTSGSLLSTLIYNVEQVAQASTDSLIILVRESFFIAGSLSMMLIINWQMSILFFIVAPFIAVVAKFSSKRLRKLSKNVQNIVGDMTHVAEEGIEGYRIIRTFGGEAYETNKFNQVAELNRKREMKFTLTNALSSPIVQSIVACIIIGTIYVATSQVGNLTAGGYVSIIVAMVLILKPMKNLSTVNTTIQKGIAAAESIFKLLDEEPELDQGKHSLDRVKGEIKFEHLSFTYQEKERTILHDINLTIKPGQTVAIVGRSGSGKSTLVSLLERFYDYESGKIAIDGIDIQTIKLADLRKQFALVSQNIILFNDTISHNIAYGRLGDATEAEILTAAKSAHALEFIEQLQDGLQTKIGEKGLRLSGGQRQRIAIARALLKNAPILILDEATSALDTESERQIQAALSNLMKNRTTLVIAHRLSTIENADMIIVMEAGRIIEQGTHLDLMALNQAYAKLHRLQFKDYEEHDNPSLV